MAIIPRSQESRRLTPSTPVPIGSASSAGIQGEALSALGQGAANLGNSIQNYSDKIQAQEDAVQTQYVNNQLQNLYKTTLDKAKDSSTPDGSNMGELYNSSYDKESAKIINSIQSPTVRKNAENFNNLIGSDAQAQIQVQSLAKKQGYVYDVMGKNANLVADRIRSNPNESLIAAEYTNFNKQLDDPAFNVLTPEQRIKLKDGTQKLFAQQLVQGFAEKEQYGRALQFLTATQKTPDVYTDISPNQAADLGLIGRDEAGQLAAKGENYKVPTLTNTKGGALSPQMAEIANGLGAADKAHMIDQMQAKLQERTAMRLGDLNAQLNGMEKLGLSGQTLDPQGVASLKNQINTNPHLTTEAKVRLFDRVNSITSANKTLQTIKSLPRNQWQSAIDGMESKVALGAQDAAKLDPKMKVPSTDFAALAERQQHKDIVMRQLSEIRKEQDKDAAAFVQQDPTIATLRAGTKDGDPSAMDRYVQASLTKQDYLGIPKENQRVLTKDEARNYANTLASLPTGQDAGTFMNQLQQQYGPNYQKVFNEVTKENENLKSMGIAAYMEDSSAKGKVFDNIRNKKAIIEGMKSSPELQTYDKAADMTVSEKMNDFRGILSAQSEEGIGVANGFQEQLQLEVKKRIQQDPTGKPDVEKIADDAYKDLVANSYSIINSASSKVIVPKAIDGKNIKEENVQAFLNVYGKGSAGGLNSHNAYNDLMVGVPSSYTKAYGEGAKNKWYSDLQQSSRWVSNGDQSGLKLMYLGNNGGLIPVLDQNGKPVEKSLLDISYKPTKAMIDNQKSFLGKLFE